MRSLALLLLAACRGPDSAAIEPYVERTNYPSETSDWDSHGYGVGFNLAWDLGRRAEANEAAIADHKIALHHEIDEQRPNQLVSGARSVIGGLDRSDASTASAVAAAFLAWINRKRLASAGKAVASKVRKKRPEDLHPRHPVEQ